MSADQWSQTYYQLRDGKLYLVHNDNKEQQYAEEEVDVATFVRDHAQAEANPHREIAAFLAACGGTR